jgi:uncharacterized delta-60 repeat protein
MRFLDISAGAEQVNDLLAMPRGDIVAAGPADTRGRPAFMIFRVHAKGHLVPGFGTDGVTRTDLGPGAEVANAMAVTRSGSFVVVGGAGYGGQLDCGVVRYLDDGSLDTGFGEAGIKILSWTSSPEAADDVLSSGARAPGRWEDPPPGTGDDAAVVRVRARGKLDGTFGAGRRVRRNRCRAWFGAPSEREVLFAGETWTAGSRPVPGGSSQRRVTRRIDEPRPAPLTRRAEVCQDAADG